jgi:hypothetical protein
MDAQKQNNQNPTTKQHFVPKFYLKLFTKNDKLQVFDVKNNRMGRPKTSSGVGYKPYFYGVKTGVADDISQHIEKWLLEYENMIANGLPAIIDKILNYKQITNDDRYTLSAFMSMLWLRNPVMRERLNKMQEDVTKHTMKFYTEERIDSYIEDTKKQISDDDRKKMIDKFETGNYKLEFNNAQHLRFMTENFGFGSSGFTNMFYGQKWKIYIAKGKRRFVTTDNPIVEWWHPPQTIYGPSFLDRKKYFSLTPEILFELTYPRGSTKVKRKTIFSEEDDVVGLFNILLTAHAREFAYSHDKSILEEILNGRSDPKSLEVEYYKRYELPWEEARVKGSV